MIQGILSVAGPGSGLGNLDGPTGSQELGRDAFMQLLVTQLRNQDPLSPTGHDEFVAQLAQFSALDEMRGVNENLVALALLQQNNALLAQLTEGSGLIGKHVSYLDPSTGEERSGVVDAVRLEDGIAQLRIDGSDVPLASVTEIHGEAGEDGGGDPDDGSQDG